MKRGEISMEVIIIAAIALLVLVILSVLVIRAATQTDKQTACEAMHGKCLSDCTGAGLGTAEFECPSGQKCCVSLGGTP